MTSTDRDARPGPSAPRRPRRLRRLRRLLLAAACGLALVTAAATVVLPREADAATLFGRQAPKAVTDSDTKAVELGVRFTSTVDGSVTALRFYKGRQDTGRHVASLWSGDGRRLARVPVAQESSSGWQTVPLAAPVAIEAGRTYVASYLAPRGRYSALNGFFDRPYSRGPLTVEAGGGVYTYSPGEFPQQSWRNSNYFVDVEFSVGPGRVGTSSPRPTPKPRLDPPPGRSATTLDLPRIPWEGGSAFWKQYAKADAAGWDDPGFFPVVAWFNGISSDKEVAYDKSLGINTYIGMWEGTPYQLFADNGVFWAGGKLNDSFTSDSKNWVGVLLDDEVDGRFLPAEGRAHLAAVARQYAGQGLFTYTNYTQMVMSKDMAPSDAEAYVNDGADVVSLDMYWYTIPYCSLRPYRDVYLEPIVQQYCRTASSYGRSVSALRQRDAADGKLKPLWQWVENLNGGPGEGPFVANVSAGQLKGAVMSSLIHEARGIAYFNQSFTGPCQGGAIFRQSEVTKDFCGAAQVRAAKQVNGQIHTLAPVLNTQSYQHRFGSGLDTMLKARDGSVYVFAMVDGASGPGPRRLTLPAEVRGRAVEVLFENRTLTADSSGTFTDAFPQEYSYHVYKIRK
jgi:hypothetical protein